MTINRRAFLQRSALTTGAAAVAGSFGNLLSLGRTGQARAAEAALGRLRPVADETTGLELLLLPEGFRYQSFGWQGEKLVDGTPTPPAHDGMAVVQADANTIMLCRNHEIGGDGHSFADDSLTYDPRAGGGCTLLSFDRLQGRFLEARSVLSGTVKNCAGGPTPWGSWLSCEETVLGPGDEDDGRRLTLERDHGYVFEVPAARPASAEPLKDMGRFVHEAVAVDPNTGIVYETEDRDTAGFYRFLPRQPGQLQEGGRLEMLRAIGVDDLRRGLEVGDTFDVSWVPIEEPTRAHSPGLQDALGVFHQGKAQGGSTFARLEGCWYGADRVYIVATSGGDKQLGQLFEHNPAEETIKLVFESPCSDVLEKPDNITVSPNGKIFLCEDGTIFRNACTYFHVTAKISVFAANNILLQGRPHGQRGDFRGQEWAGATFSPDGKWLFVNIQTPGVTFAITGPFA